MKITTFNPMILSPKADEAIKLFEELGFEKKHAPVVETESNKSALMTSPSGFAFDLCQHIKDHD